MAVTKRLNVACGPFSMKGWVNIDSAEQPGVDRVVDALAERIPIADSDFHEIYIGHFLEHVPETKTSAFLAEIFRILKPRGKLTVVVPDFKGAINDYLHGRINIEYMFHHVILGYMLHADAVISPSFKGAEAASKDLCMETVALPHRNLYDADKLFNTLNNAGFIGITEEDIATSKLVVARDSGQCGFTCRKPGPKC